MKNFFQEFMRFAMKGNVLDLAVGVIIGGAFGKIVSSLANDVITPMIGKLIGNIKLNTLHVGPVVIGNFLQATIDFIITAFAIFLFIRGIGLIRLRRKDLTPPPPPPPPMPTKEEQLLTEIRDLLKQGNRQVQ